MSTGRGRRYADDSRFRRRAAVLVCRLLGIAYRHYLTPSRIGQYAATRKPCSCCVCGNPRRWFGDVTRQEKMVAQGE